MSKRPIIQVLKIVLPILLGVFLIWYSLSKISISGLLEYFKNANYLYIFLGVIFGLLSHLSRAYRWLFMLEPMGYKVKMGNSIMAVFAAYLINYTIPRAGEVARATVLTNYEGVPFQKGFGTIVAERVADFIVMLLIIGVTLVLQFEFIFNFFAEKFDLNKLIVAFSILLILGLLSIIYIKKSSSKITIKIKNFANGLIEGALSVFKMKKKWAFIFHTLFIWAMYISMFYITTFAIKDLGNVSIGAVLIGFILATFSIAATNGGIGSYPEAIVIAFTLFGLPEDPSRAFGWIMWTSQTLLIFVLGGLSLLYLPFFNRNK
ncbi:lysylphosphatidylglycerol synthase transmembrane domain-containing protein [Mesoflavibacter zeaxanthinifaciens]|uniref:TIGR00374 family protein n=1 Tax=Mesoflavibacter zeaxanthinifaciens subsp. sabulilitoris TaxID=1520893 RepID=A0A2T1NI88_9FLAO|nr:lysylphosphatidylglycerol synthase transmembrane domain-containing protein [Mesoflavibacter zeaxanthinifaciens]PSG92546.1 TIGR00374 family protein [Mesoflavibacter zeaxanthinifaciens subsp. sabulilitoris]